MQKIPVPSFFRLTAGVVIALVSLWVVGFLIFLASVEFAKPENADKPSDVVIVLTGGPGRIEEGFNLMAQNRAKAMLVTGVHPNVTLSQLMERWNGDADAKTRLTNHCCIFIEHKAESTEDNAAEASAWLGRNGGAQGVSARVITSDYHMPRAMLLFRRAMPDAQLEAWPVKSANNGTVTFMRTVLIEYSKTLLTWLS